MHAPRCLFTLVTLAGLAPIQAFGSSPPVSAVAGGLASADFPDMSHVPDARPRKEKIRPVSLRPYVVFGRRYKPMRSAEGYVERGIASWYGKKFHGRKTSIGEYYDMYGMTAAHKTLPLPMYVRVSNLENGRSIVVRVNDRGPFYDERIIDLSYSAASKLGMAHKGTAMVEVRAIDFPGAGRLAQTGPKKPPQQKNPRTGSTPIYLHLGTFGNLTIAQGLSVRLERYLDRPVRLESVDTNKGRVHRVQVGPFDSVETADQAAMQLENIEMEQW